MKIDKYSFGQIKISGEEYTSDLLICGEKIKPDWWREEGHSLCLGDLSWILDREPDVLIIGTGKSGVMKVPNKVIEKLEEEGIEVVAKTTTEAVKTYNNLDSSSQIIAAGFHLTC